MCEPLKTMDLSSLTQDQQNQQQQIQQHHIQQQQHQNQKYYGQTYNPSYYYHTPQQNPNHACYPEPAPNYQTTPGTGQGLGQQNPDYADYYRPNGYPQKRHENAQNYQTATGMTPSAVALSQFSGSMEGAAWIGQGQRGQFAGSSAVQPVYMGNCRRGSMPFRRRGPGRGRGHGRTSFSHMLPNGAMSSSNTNPSTDGATEPTANYQEETKPETAASNKAPARAFRCELCKIDCNGLDILEQHKNGKRHKKNLEKGGQLESEYVAPKTLEENVTKGSGEELGSIVAESMTSERGTKRKLRGGRNGKSTRKANEPPKVVIPKLCDLCNVACNTQEVYDCHLAGKKHMSKLKRYEGHQSLYGAVGLQALYPPISQTLVQQQGPQQACTGPVPQPGPPPHPGYTMPGPSS